MGVLILALPLGSSQNPIPMEVNSLPQQQPAPWDAAANLDIPLMETVHRNYRITAERRALLNTIRYAEGTWIGGSPQGYRVIFGGSLIANLKRHPEVVVDRGYLSAAAGAYQFLPDTWKEAALRLQLPDFSPASQDQAALYLVEKRGALRHFDRRGLSHEVLAQLAPEWASLPTRSGESFYGQPVKEAGELISFYRTQLLIQHGGSRTEGGHSQPQQPVGQPDQA